MPRRPGAAGLAGSVLVWLAATLADIQVVQAIILLPLIFATIWAMAGARVSRLLLFPVMYAAFALPVWSPLLPVLRAITAAGAFFLVRLSGITAHLQDYEVQLPSGRLSIESACSGLNYLLAALALGVFYAWLNYRNFHSRLLVVAIAAAAALLANILRVFVIIYLADATDMQHPFVKEHLMLGWYLFGALVLVLLFVDHLLYARRAAEPEAVREAVRTTGSADCGYLRRRLLPIVVVALVVSGPAAAWWIKQRALVLPATSLQLPSGQSGWSGPVSLNDSWLPLYHGATGFSSSYHKHGMQVLLYVGYYPSQRQGSELVNELNDISGGAGWEQGDTQSRVVSSGGQHLIETELVSAHGERRLVWYRYRVAGHYTVNDYAAKVLQVAGMLAGRYDAAVFAMAVDSNDNPSAARDGLEDFLAAMGPALARFGGNQQNEQGRHK